jgi:hypothetical protein
MTVEYFKGDDGKWGWRNIVDGQNLSHDYGFASRKAAKQSYEASLVTQPTTNPFGAMGPAFRTDPSKAKAWGPWFRDMQPLMDSTGKYLTTFRGAVGVDAMHAIGEKVTLTVIHGDGTPYQEERQVLDEAACRQAFKACLEQTRPDKVVVGNEVNTVIDAATGQPLWRNNIPAWERYLALAVAEAKAQGIPVGGAALLSDTVAHGTYRWLLQTKGQSAASAFLPNLAGAPSTLKADLSDGFIDACRDARADAAVWHSYVSDTTGLISMKDYVESRFGGPSWNNEWGWRSGNASDGIALIDAFVSSGIEQALIYGSGLGTNSPDQLWTPAGDPTPEGQAITERIAQL